MNYKENFMMLAGTQLSPAFWASSCLSCSHMLNQQCTSYSLTCFLLSKVVRTWLHSWVTFLLPLRCWFGQHSDHFCFILRVKYLIASGVGELNGCFSKAFTKSVFNAIWNSWHNQTINGILINWERLRLPHCA